MRFSIDFARALIVLLRKSFPIWAGISLFITVGGFLLAWLEGLPIGVGLYFAWVTGTTVGYGDLTPTSAPARLVAIVVALFGILFTGFIVALALEAAKLSIGVNGSLDDVRRAAERRLTAKPIGRRTDRK